MCLSRVDYHTKHIKTGYKVVHRESRRHGLFSEDSSYAYYPEYQHTYRSIPPNKWINEKAYRPSSMKYNDKNTLTVTDFYAGSECGVEYPAGFHVFVSRKAAEAWLDAGGHPSSAIIVKVKVRNCIASGYQRCGLRWHHLAYYRTVVAKQIKIVEVLP